MERPVMTPEVPYTNVELQDQRLALVREIPAWLVANDPDNPSRRRLAVREIRRITREGYVADDLDDDVQWVLNQDLGLRLPIVAYLAEDARRTLIGLAAAVASVRTGLSPSDAQFIELLGAGLQLDPEEVTGIVMSAVQNEALRAA
jgi:hypothetical protein